VQALAALVGVQAVLHEPTLEAYVQRRHLSGRGELTPALLRMATVPQGARVYQNPAGWAPCISVSKATTTFFALPGPPQEMEAVFTMCLMPFFTTTYPAHAASLRVAVNMYESELAPLFAQVRARYPTTYLKGYIALGGRDTPHGMPLDIIARSTEGVPAETILQQAVAYLSELLAAQGQTLRHI
jgi:molybdopterin-biosynthesis enzyme MoeA-like protein